MSDKLIVEFYAAYDLVTPTGCVLTCHGGDNPSSAATTLADFFDALAVLKDPRYEDAAVLAARFVFWEAGKSLESQPLDFDDVSLIPFQKDYGYQVARVYANNHRPYVHCVTDQWTTDQELFEAAILLRQPDAGRPAILLDRS